MAPGFVDVQVNGGGGVLFNDQPTVAGIRAIGAAHRRLHGEAAGVAIEVQHARAGAKSGDETAVVALIEKPAGLLSGARIGKKARAVLDELDRAFGKQVV